MSAPNKEFLNTVRILLLGAPLVLAACTSDFGPFPLPTGYHYHNDVLKTPPGPEPVFKKIEHMHDGHPVADCPVIHPGVAAVTAPPAPPPVMMGTPVPAPVMPALATAATDLVQRMVDQFGQPVEPVYVVPAAGNAHEAGFADALRGALADHGFNVAPEPGLSPFTLDYSVGMPGSIGGRSMVKVTLVGQEGILSEQSGLYDLGAPETEIILDVPVTIIEAPPEPAAPVSQGAPLPLGPD